MTVRIDRVVTAGVFSLDGEDHEVENNIWLIGDDHEVIVIDAAHDAEPIAEAVGGRRLHAIVCTHGHNDHINAALDLADRFGAETALHPNDRMLWDEVHPGRPPDNALADGQRISVAEAVLEVIHTPGHSPGGVCIHLPDEGVLFSGDTLFSGGPGATGRSFSDRDTIIASIQQRLMTLPASTVVHTGHGPSTTIGDESPNITA